MAVPGPAVAGNIATPEKTELGKARFFDLQLAALGVFSCGSCQNLATGGDGNMETSVGHGQAVGTWNAPTVLNSAPNEAQFWDGRAADLAARAKGPVQASVEMANTPENTVATLKSMPLYGAWFRAAFPDEEDLANFDNMAKATEVSEATLLAPAPFDRWLHGDDLAMSDDAKAGLRLFIDKGRSTCHPGMNVGGQGCHSFGLVEKGRRRYPAAWRQGPFRRG